MLRRPPFQDVPILSIAELSGEPIVVGHRTTVKMHYG